MRRARAAALARHLLAAYVLLVIYASLHPLAGWRDTGAPVLAFVTAAWPRYYTGFDVALNIAGYVPLAMLAVPALLARVGARAAVALAVLGAAALSFGLETAQNFLPSRVPSNLDFAANVLGALLGAALGLRYAGVFADGGALARWRQRRLVAGSAGELGLTLLALWLLTQANADALLFGSGDLRDLLGMSAAVPYSAPLFYALEALVAAAGTLAVGLLAWRMMREPSAWLLALLLVLALVIKAVAWAVLVGPAETLHWVTPGNRVGLLAGMLALAVAIVLPAGLQLPVAALALLALTALVNLAPNNPYAIETLLRWQQGHFFNFNGLTRIASGLWPFVALAYLVTVPGRGR